MSTSARSKRRIWFAKIAIDYVPAGAVQTVKGLEGLVLSSHASAVEVEIGSRRIWFTRAEVSLSPEAAR